MAGWTPSMEDLALVMGGTITSRLSDSGVSETGSTQSEKPFSAGRRPHIQSRLDTSSLDEQLRAYKNQDSERRRVQDRAYDRGRDRDRDIDRPSEREMHRSGRDRHREREREGYPVRNKSPPRTSNQRPPTHRRRSPQPNRRRSRSRSPESRRRQDRSRSPNLGRWGAQQHSSSAGGGKRRRSNDGVHRMPPPRSRSPDGYPGRGQFAHALGARAPPAGQPPPRAVQQPPPSWAPPPATSTGAKKLRKKRIREIMIDGSQWQEWVHPTAINKADNTTGYYFYLVKGEGGERRGGGVKKEQKRRKMHAHTNTLSSSPLGPSYDTLG